MRNYRKTICLLTTNIILCLVCFCSCQTTESSHNYDADAKVYQGIITNNIEMIHEGILGGADLEYLSPTVTHSRYVTALAIAIYETQNEDIIIYLLDNGADGNGIIEYGVTALMYCAMNNMYRVCDHILQHTSNTEYRDTINARTALDYAMAEIHYENESLKMLDLFIYHNAEITSSTFFCALTNGYANDIASAQTFSSHYKKIQKIYSSLSNNQELQLHDALDYAIQGDSNKMLKHLDGRLSPNEVKLVAFFTAAFGNVDSMKCLLEKEIITKDIKDERGNNLSVIAATYNNLEMLKYLLSLDIAVTENNHHYEKQRMTPSNALILSIRTQSYDTIEFLLTEQYFTPNNSVINDTQKYFSPELEELIVNCDVNVLLILLKHQFILNEIDTQFLKDQGAIYAQKYKLYNEYENILSLLDELE